GPSGPARSTPTTPSSARACLSTTGRWSRRTPRRSRSPSRCARPPRACSTPSPSKARPDASMNVVLGVSGGIAAYKACELLRLFTESGHDVRVVPTRDALRFVGEPTWAALSGNPVTTDVWDSVHEVPHVRIGQA